MTTEGEGLDDEIDMDDPNAEAKARWEAYQDAKMHERWHRELDLDEIIQEDANDPA